MEKDQIIILEDRGLISISGDDSKEFLQNVITNDIEKVKVDRSIFSGIFSPQGKYMYEFFVIYRKGGYLLDCDSSATKNLISHLAKYRLGSKIEIIDVSSNFVIGVLNFDKFKELFDGSKYKTIVYRDSPIFLDPRDSKLGARILSPIDKLYLTIKKLNLKIIDSKIYLKNAYLLGVPEKGLEHLKDQLFGLEANFEKLNAIDFKKGCYIGQENTARMKLKDKVRKKLLPLFSDEILNIGDDLLFNNKKIGKVLISKPFPFGLIKIFDPDLKSLENEELIAGKKKCKILKSS